MPRRRRVLTALRPCATALALLLAAGAVVTPARADAPSSKSKRKKKKGKKKAEATVEATAEETETTPAADPDAEAPAEPTDDGEPTEGSEPTDDAEPADDAEPTGDTAPTDGGDIASPVAEAPSRVDAQKVAGLEAEARAVSDELFKARARVSTLASKLFRTKIDLELRSNLERFWEVSDLVIAVDGAPVVTQESGVPTAADELFVLYAAPGAHEVSFSANLVARRDATYKLRLHQSFTVVVPEDSTVSTKLVVRETGNMWRFAKRRRGRSAIRAILRARARPNERGRRSRGKASVSASGQGGTR